jgi:hypothetical protein
MNDFISLSIIFRRRRERRSPRRRRKIKRREKIKKRGRKIGVMESIGIRKTKRKSIERKRRRIEKKVAHQMKRDFRGKLSLTMEEIKPQVKGNFLGNLSISMEIKPWMAGNFQRNLRVMVERLLLRRVRKGMRRGIASLVRRNLLANFQVTMVRSSFKLTAIYLTIIGILNLYKSWEREPEMKTKTSSLRSFLVKMQKGMREWSDWWRKPLATGLMEKKRTREMMVETWMVKESGMKQDLMAVLRAFLQHFKVDVMRRQEHWRKTLRRWKGRISPNKRKAIINASIKRKKAKRRRKSGIRRRKGRRNQRRKVSIRRTSKIN